MRQPLDRRNTSALGRWWFTVDRPAFFAMMALVCIGFFLVMAASPPVAVRIGLPPLYFVTHHEVFLGISTVVMVVVSMLDATRVRKLALLGFAASAMLMLLLPVIGTENKGAIRWIHFPLGLSMQPSEFMKPCFAVVLAWIFSHGINHAGFRSYRIAIVVYLVIAAMLITQPDFGMTVTISGMFAVQFFLAGLPFIWVVGMGVIGVGGVFMAYFALPHVASRIDRFLDPAAGDNFQVEKSLQAFKSGGWFGRGPGEGLVKQHIPDSHTDFIFAVAGEELGMFFCLFIITLFAFIVVRGFLRLGKETDTFSMLAVGGLLAEFGIQAIVNMGVAVNLLPAKGMTLPFLSYGGSSLIAMAGGMGMMLALTRKRFGQPKPGKLRGNARYHVA